MAKLPARLPRNHRALQFMVLLWSFSLFVPGITHAESLFDIYLKAREYDAEMHAARYNHQAALQAVPLARSTLRPQANATLQSGFNDVNPDSSDNYLQNRLTLSIRQALYNKPGSIGVDQAKLQRTESEIGLRVQEQALMMRVANTYFNVLKADAELEFSRAELEAISRQREQNERRFDVGLVPITDLKNAQAQYDLANAREIAAANQLEAAKESLIAISGANPDNLLKLQENTPLVTPDPANIQDWLKIAEEQNLSLMLAKIAVESAKSNVDASRAARHPTVDIVGLASRTETGQQGRPDTDAGEIRLELNMPLLTGGRTTAQIHQARSQMEAINQNLVAQRRATVQNTRTAYRNVIADVSRVKALRQALLSTQKSLEAQEAGYREGLLTSLEVLRSLQDTFSAQSAYSAARYDYILNLLLLKQAAGILTESDLQEIDGWLLQPQ